MPDVLKRHHISGHQKSSLTPCSQADRALINIRSMANDLDRHSYLTALQERNESLFYKLLVDNIKELLPIVHMPTVSEYCAKYALMFRSLPRALFISLKDKGEAQLHT